MWVALFALACQLVLSFGHIHLGKNVAAGWTAAPYAASTTGAPEAPPNPASSTDDFCAICANINLAGTLVLPILAFVLAPAAVTVALPIPEADEKPQSIAYLLFSARGPPTA